MKNRFDLEQEIMDCWGIVEDLKAIEEAVLDGDDFRGMQPKHSDKIANLLAIHHMYQLKFERLWSTFEHCVSQRLLESGNPNKELYTDLISDGGMDPRGPYEEERRKGKKKK